MGCEGSAQQCIHFVIVETENTIIIMTNYDCICTGQYYSCTGCTVNVIITKKQRTAHVYTS